MTKLLALDVATRTGYAVLHHEEGKVPMLFEYGSVDLPRAVADFGPYPWNYVHAARELANDLAGLVVRIQPDVLVVENTNLGRARSSQKLLEFLHNSLLVALDKFPEARGMLTPPVFYVSSSMWRRALGLQLSAEDRRSNSKLSKAKSKAKQAGGKPDKKSLGIKGRIGWKHLAIRWVHEHYNLALKMKDDDVADAICLGVAFTQGVHRDDE